MGVWSLGCWTTRKSPLLTMFKRVVQGVKYMHSVAAIATRTVSSCEPGTLPPLKHHLPDLPSIRSWCLPPYVLSVDSVTRESAATRCLLVPCDRLAALPQGPQGPAVAGVRLPFLSRLQHTLLCRWTQGADTPAPLPSMPWSVCRVGLLGPLDSLRKPSCFPSCPTRGAQGSPQALLSVF